GFAPDTVYLGNCSYIDFIRKLLSLHSGRVQSLEDLVRVKTVWNAGGHIVQPEVLFPHELFLTVGGLDCNNHFTMEFDLWGKFFLAGATFQYTDIPFGMFREHPDQKINDVFRTTESLLSTAAQLARVAGCFSEQPGKEIFEQSEAYEERR